MSDITIGYKGSTIGTMDATGTKTLLTSGKYCEDDIAVEYVKPSGGGSGADYSKLVAGTYGNVVVDSDGVMTSSTAFTTNYAYPLTKPIQINSGDVIQIAVLSSIRAFHEWHLMNGTTELQSATTTNL